MSAAEDRRYWRERAREVLPSATARELVRAAHLLRKCYDEPTVTYDACGSMLAADSHARTDAGMFAGRAGGGVPDHSPAPSAYDARRHDLKASGEVGKRGRARVQGAAISIDDSPRGVSPALMCQMLRDLPRNTVGALAWDVEALTHLFYGAAIPELLGSDTIAYRQVVHAAPESDPYTARGVVGRESAEAKPARWQTRTRLRAVRARKSETAGAASSALVAPADRPDRIFIGHRCQPRGKVAARKPRTVKLDRTIGTVTATRDMLAVRAIAAASALNRGERLVIVCDGVTLTLTRGKSDAGTFGLTAPNGRADGIRTPKAVAAQALKLTA